MSGKSLFGRDDDGGTDEPGGEAAPGGADEGVRLIEPDPSDAPKKPAPRPAAKPKPVEGAKKAAIKLPLAGSADVADIARPKVAPVTPPVTQATKVSLGADAPAQPTGEAGGGAAPRRPGDEPGRGATDTGSQPIVSVEPPTGEVQLPHWTEPATGEVPKVVIGETPADDEEDQDAWDSYAAAGPRYRDQHDNWDDSLVTDLIDADDASLGAIAAEGEARPTQDEFLGFDDLDVPDLEQPKAPTRGSAADPVLAARAGRTGQTPAVRSKKAAKRPASGAPRKGVVRERPPRAGQAGDAPADDAERSVADRLGVEVSGTSGGGRNWPVAIGVGLAIGISALVIFKLPQRWPAMLVCTVIIFLAGAEFLAAVRSRRFKPVMPLGWAALIGLPVAAYYRGDVGIPLVLFLTVFFGFVWYIVGQAGEKPLGNLAVTFFAVVYVGMFGSFATLLLRTGQVLVDGVYTEGEQGPSLVILAVLAAVAYDVGGAGFGTLYGKRTFTAISPNKTIEGLLGGVLTSIVIVTIIGGVAHVGPFGLGGAFFFALCCAIAAPLGDLAESLLKRDLGMKDMSDLIPGHGGVLDRFDALLFVLPVAYYATRLIFPNLPYAG